MSEWLLLATHAVSFLALVGLLVGVLHTVALEHGERRERFRTGRAPAALPNRLYLAATPRRSWIGENFDASCALGNDAFRKDGAYADRRFFRMYVTSGMRDLDTDVLTPDYDLPANPFWTRCFLMELVEIEPKKLFGKRYMRVIPGFPFTLGYVEFQREF